MDFVTVFYRRMPHTLYYTENLPYMEKCITVEKRSIPWMYYWRLITSVKFDMSLRDGREAFMIPPYGPPQAQPYVRIRSSTRVSIKRVTPASHWDRTCLPHTASLSRVNIPTEFSILGKQVCELFANMETGSWKDVGPACPSFPSTFEVLKIRRLCAIGS